MKVVVLGGTGNVGSAVLRRLCAQPEVRSLSAVSRRRPAPDEPPFVDVDWLSADLGDDDVVPQLTAHLRGADAVVHLAWQIQPGRDEAQLWRTNVDGSRHVLAAVAAADVPHLVVMSSVGVYSAGPKDRPVDEDWPRLGVRTSTYSRHKVVVEDLLDGFERSRPDVVVSRLRPGLVFGTWAGSEIARFFLGPLVPTSLLGRLHVPQLPLPPELVFQCVQADDLAAAVWTVLRENASGAFNVAAEPALGPDDLARSVGAGSSRPMPLRLLRGAAAASWRAHLQPTDPGWVDLAASVPLMSTGRLRSLGWEPRTPAVEALEEVVTAMRRGDGGPGPALRRRGLLRGRSA